jgi:RNA polymerase sigma-70 factor (ECF subfamily)
MSEYTDKELLELFRNGTNPNYAFNLLVKKYQEPVYWHIRRMVINHEDANDLVQDVFVKAWKGLNNFREDSKFYTWLYRIATNESITFLNKKKRKHWLSLNSVEHKLEENLEDDNFFRGEEIQRKLQKAILKLPGKQRAVFNMKYFDEMKYEDISSVMGTSVGALKASYHHAVKKIESYLKED